MSPPLLSTQYTTTLTQCAQFIQDMQREMLFITSMASIRHPIYYLSLLKVWGQAVDHGITFVPQPKPQKAVVQAQEHLAFASKVCKSTGHDFAHSRLQLWANLQSLPWHNTAQHSNGTISNKHEGLRAHQYTSLVTQCDPLESTSRATSPLCMLGFCKAVLLNHPLTAGMLVAG